MTVLSARWSPRCIFKTRLVGAGVSSYTARPCGLVCQSCSHCVFITSRIPLLFGGAFAGLVAGLLLQLWLLPSCLNAHGTVAILLPCYSHSPGRENSCSFPLPINLSPVSPQDRWNNQRIQVVTPVSEATVRQGCSRFADLPILPILYRWLYYIVSLEGWRYYLTIMIGKPWLWLYYIDKLLTISSNRQNYLIRTSSLEHS